MWTLLRGFYFRESSRSFVKIKLFKLAKSLWLIDVGKLYPTRKYLTSQKRLFTLFAKIKFLRKFPNLQYIKGKSGSSLRMHLIQKILYTVKPVLSGHSKKKTAVGFQDQLSLNAGQNYCCML